MKNYSHKGPYYWVVLVFEIESCCIDVCIMWQTCLSIKTNFHINISYSCCAKKSCFRFKSFLEIIIERKKKKERIVWHILQIGLWQSQRMAQFFPGTKKRCFTWLLRKNPIGTLQVFSFCFLVFLIRFTIGLMTWWSIEWQVVVIGRLDKQILNHILSCIGC